MSYELGIIGAGNMAEAIARGVIRAGLFRADQLVAADVSPQRRELFARDIGVRSVESNEEAARAARMLLLSVKPQQMAQALAGIGAVLAPDALVISIAAGITTSFIEQHLGAGRSWRVVRTMPNTPMLVGEGMTALAPGAHATAADLAAARRIFESAGAVIEVREEMLDAVTALSGSGPAYVFYLAENMIAAGIEMGFPPDQARLLATRTIAGAAKMLATSPEPPQELRRKVTSPGGTTQAAITHLEGASVGPALVQAIRAAERRGRELKEAATKPR
jgi:pyrroline-5-carboxylate reductase